MNTLKGVFPPAKRPPRRNFLKENMVHIKQQEQAIKIIKSNYMQNYNPERRSANKRRTTVHETKPNNKVITAEKPKMITVDHSQLSSQRYDNACCRNAVESALKNVLKDKYKSKDIGIQTDFNTSPRSPRKAESPEKIAHEGLTVSLQAKQKSPKQSHNSHDNQVESSGGKKDFMKENVQILKNIAAEKRAMYLKKDNSNDIPSDYKRGVVPKYIKERKEELYKQAKSPEGDERCPDGHVMLPDNERKETLRMFRQSYAEIITELNNLPVRSDTLKVKNRKMEIERQLKKLDEGIKVFSRPQVYVKIGA